MLRRVLPVLTATAALAAVLAPSASAFSTHACARSTGFRCGTVTVPLDRSGGVPGTIALNVAVEAPRRGTSGWLLALSGGPGQPSVAFAQSFRASLAPALQHRRLVVMDQRGTGDSGALRCPKLQALGTLDVVNTSIVEACMRSLGPARQFYSTTQSVQDIDAVRQALGAPKLELMGVSYGTYVAAQYARQFPASTEGLILDSVVGPDGIDPYFLDTFERLPRILAEQCRGSRCRGATNDPVADLGTLARRLASRGPLRGRVPDVHGALHATAVHDESELLLIIMSGDLNPFLQAALPGAINAAGHGDAAPLLRLRRIAQGPFTPVSEFSSTLNVATTCADVRLPYTFAEPVGQRWTEWQHGSDSVPDAAFAPFSRLAVVDTSVAHDCLRWPQGDTLTAPSTAPLPDVPTLLLSGRLDTRTPTENAKEMLPLLPHAQLLQVAGTGHDILDSDISGCAAKALKLWADGRQVGSTCARADNAVSVLARPAGSIRDYRRPKSVPGERGRLLYATLDTIIDAQVSALQTLYAGYTRLQGGGLRAGRWSASGDGGRLKLHGYSLVPGLRVSGALGAGATGSDYGTVTVDGPGRLDGTLTISGKGAIRGTLGGKAIRYSTRDATVSAAAASAGRGRLPQRLRSPSAATIRRQVAWLRATR